MPSSELSWAIIIALLLLIILVAMAWMALSRLAEIKELWERVRDKLSRLNSGLDKLDTAADWFLGREGLKLDYMHATWRWYVTTREDTGNIYRTMKELDRDKREALAKALYEANIQAMRDFSNEQKKEAKKK